MKEAEGGWGEERKHFHLCSVPLTAHWAHRNDAKEEEGESAVLTWRLISSKSFYLTYAMQQIINVFCFASLRK